MHVNVHVFTCMFYMHVNMHVTKHACFMHVFTCMSDFAGSKLLLEVASNQGFRVTAKYQSTK
jgi:hypothetical protein